MLPVIDKPVIQYVVEEAVASGITDILIITGRGKQAIENHFDRSLELEQELERAGKDRQLQEVRRLASLASIHYVRQTTLLGLGHAVYLAREHVGDEPFVVMLGDTIIEAPVPATRILIDAWNLLSAPVVGVERIEARNVSRFGMVLASPQRSPGTFRVEQVFEKPTPQRAPSDLALIGRYVFAPSVFDALSGPAEEAESSGARVELSDAIDVLAHSGAVYAQLIEGRRFDIGDRLGYLEAVLRLGLGRSDIAPELRSLLRRIPGEQQTAGDG
jgi:UTP--glucose-1-phosphate uridylyltransferase